MKNWILFFYNIDINDIHRSREMYKFNYNGCNYIFEKLPDSGEQKQNISNVYNLCINLIMNNIPCNEIILNKNNEIISLIDNNAFILFKTCKNFSDKIKFNDLISYRYKINDIKTIDKHNNWKELWSNKIDYFEYQINQFGIKYPLIRESFGYFSGIAENGISLLNYITNNNLYLSHRRIDKNTTYYDLYNPFNMILDTQVRDTSDYIKDCFIHNEKVSIVQYLNGIKLTDNEKILFFIRMLYPSFYFDIYEKIIQNHNENILIDTIKKTSDYELLLSQLMNFINKDKELIPKIDWIKK